MTTNLRLYVTQELPNEGTKLIPIYHIKVETYWLEKISSDGRYYEFEDYNKYKKAISLLKKKYGNVKIINPSNQKQNENRI